MQQGPGATCSTYRVQVEFSSEHNPTTVGFVPWFSRPTLPTDLLFLFCYVASADLLIGVADKRNKRLRPGSGAPSSTSSASLPLQPPATSSHLPQGTTSLAVGSGSGLSLVLPARDANAISAKYSRHFPLVPGRKVAFKVPPAEDQSGEAAEEGGWILAVVKKVEKGNRSSVPVYVKTLILVTYNVKCGAGTMYKTSKARKAVRPCKVSSVPCTARCTHHSFLLYRIYTTTARSLIPLPDPNAVPNSAAHPSQYPELSKGTVVLALYPDTTAFYRAEVVATPRDSLVASLRVRLTVPCYHSD